MEDSTVSNCALITLNSEVYGPLNQNTDSFAVMLSYHVSGRRWHGNFADLRGA